MGEIPPFPPPPFQRGARGDRKGVRGLGFLIHIFKFDAPVGWGGQGGNNYNHNQNLSFRRNPPNIKHSNSLNLWFTNSLSVSKICSAYFINDLKSQTRFSRDIPWNIPNLVYLSKNCCNIKSACLVGAIRESPLHKKPGLWEGNVSIVENLIQTRFPWFFIPILPDLI